MNWCLHLGGLGLIPLGVLGSSLLPIPGAADVAAILLAARDPDLWFYYAAMATLGSVLGGFLTYRIARKGGQEALAKKLPRKNVAGIQKIFARWGFSAIVVVALLPPPFPFAPFLVAAGSMQYPATKFLTALTVGRLARYYILALLAAHYGRQIFFLFHSATIISAGVAIAIASGIIALLVRAKHRSAKPA